MELKYTGIGTAVGGRIEAGLTKGNAHQFFRIETVLSGKFTYRIGHRRNRHRGENYADGSRFRRGGRGRCGCGRRSGGSKSKWPHFAEATRGGGGKGNQIPGRY